MRIIGACLLSSLLFSAGCSTTIPVNYIPSPSIKGQGAVRAGQFSYVPFSRGEVKANQFQSSTVSIGEIYLSEKVSDLIQSALRKELIAAGFDPDAEGMEISGTVEKFSFDWTGFTEMDMYLDVRYKAIKGGQVVLEEVVRSHKAMPKVPGYDSEAARSVISDNLSKMLLKLRESKLI